MVVAIVCVNLAINHNNYIVSRYREGLAAVEAGKWSLAVERFLEVGLDYGESAIKIREPAYKLGIQAMKSQEYLKATGYFGYAVRYEDANIRLKKAYQSVQKFVCVESGVYTAVQPDGSLKWIEAKTPVHAEAVNTIKGWNSIAKILSNSSQTKVKVVALRKDGRILCQGDYSGAANWTDIQDIWIDGPQLIGLKTDGSLIITEEKVNRWHSYDYHLTKEIGWVDLQSILHMGDSIYTVGLKKDGAVLYSGQNEKLQSEVKTWSNIVKISASKNAIAGLNGYGKVFVTGDDFRFTMDEPAEDVWLFDNTLIIQLTSGNMVYSLSSKEEDRYKDGLWDTDYWSDIVYADIQDTIGVGLTYSGKIKLTGILKPSSMWDKTSA